MIKMIKYLQARRQQVRGAVQMWYGGDSEKDSERFKFYF